MYLFHPVFNFYTPEKEQKNPHQTKDQKTTKKQNPKKPLASNLSNFIQFFVIFFLDAKPYIYSIYLVIGQCLELLLNWE